MYFQKKFEYQNTNFKTLIIISIDNERLKIIFKYNTHHLPYSFLDFGGKNFNKL